MSVTAKGTAHIRHADTGEVYEIHADELDWQEVAADEREMGMEIGYLAQVDHPALGTLEWEVWEYPAGAFNDQDVNVGRHSMLDNFSISVSDAPDSADEPDDDDSVDEESEEFKSKVEHLVEWFRERYEDPAQRTSYVTAEGGYLWNFGGPYDAREVLSYEFAEEEAVLDAAVREIESDGIFEWAPAPGNEDLPYGHVLRDDDDPSDDRQREQSESRAVRILGEHLFQVVREVPPPRPGPRFGIDLAGRIELIGWTAASDVQRPSAFALLTQLREGAQDLVESLHGTNAHSQLLEETERYLVAVRKSDLTIEELYARGVRLENADFALATDIAAGEIPPLPTRVAGALQTLLHLHGSAIMADPQGRNFVEGATAYRRPSGATADAQAAAKRFSNAVRKAGDIAGPAAQSAVEEAAEALGAGPNPERSTQVSAGILSDFVRTLSSVLKFADAGMMGRFTWEVLKGTVVVGGVVGATTDGLNHVLAFLIEQAPNLVALAPIIGTEMPWLLRLAEVLDNMRRWLNTRLGRTD